MEIIRIETLDELARLLDAQLGVTDFLHHEIAREAARRLDDDRPRTIALDPLKHGREARACVDGISTAHGCVVELPH